MAEPEQEPLSIVGRYASNGTIETWPDVALDGGAYDRHACTLQRLHGTNDFIVVPLGMTVEKRDEWLLTHGLDKPAKTHAATVPAEPEPVDYDARNLDQLRALADLRGVSLQGKTLKADIIQALQDAESNQ